MTQTSQNGWPVSPSDMTVLVVDGVSCGGVRSGPVFVVMRYVATRYDREVQRLKAGQCGGYNPRSIAGSKTPSNHASATANDFNWNDNPEHKRTMTATERAACHAIVDDCDGVVRWGGDYAGTDVDEMHWEINKGQAAVAALAAKITEEDMAMTAADVKTLASTDNVFKAPAGSKNADGTPNEYWSMASYLLNTYNNSVAAKTYASQALAAVKALASPAALAAAVVAALPKGSDPISQEEVTVAVEAAFAKAFAGEQA